jgi:hypothetical protein
MIDQYQDGIAACHKPEHKFLLVFFASLVRQAPGQREETFQ